jgi:hypothetical protein
VEICGLPFPVIPNEVRDLYVVRDLREPTPIESGIEFEQIYSGQYACQLNKHPPSHNRIQKDDGKRNQQLHGKVDHRHHPVRNLPLVGQDLIKMKPVGFEDIHKFFHKLIHKFSQILSQISTNIFAHRLLRNTLIISLFSVHLCSLWAITFFCVPLCFLWVIF